MRWLPAVFCLLMATACDRTGPVGPTVPLNERFTGDSRCPVDAVCIQVAAYELHTGDSSRASVVHDGGRLSLVDLRPFPFSSRTIAPQEYRATFTVTRV
jgi:hypothetical protein